MNRIDVVGCFEAAHATFDNLRFKSRKTKNAASLDAFWTERIAEVIRARAATLELIEAAREARDEMKRHGAEYRLAFRSRQRLEAALEKVST